MSKETTVLPVVSGPVHNALPAVPYFAPMPLQPGEIEPEVPSVPLSHYIWIIRRHIWRIVAFVFACVLAAFLASSRIQPIYESTATVDIDRQAPSGVVGEDSTRSSGSPYDADQFLATQIKLIQSDAVIRPVAEQYHLLEREGQLKPKNGVMPPMSDAPITLRRLQVTRPPNTYLLLISYRSPDSRLAADVANAIAQSYLNNTFNIRIRSSASLATFMEKQLDELKAKMERSSLALAQFEKDLNVINPEEKTNILSARLLQLNTEYTNAQAERVKSEAIWNAAKSGSLEAAQVSNQGESLIQLSQSLSMAQQRFAMVKSTYGSSHPEYRKAASEVAELQKEFDDARHNITDRIGVQYREAVNREQMLKTALDEAKAEWDQINARSFEYQRLKQEAETDKTLYEELIKKIREADINSGFQNNNIRIADMARPTMAPVFPNTRLNVLIAFFFATLLAISAAIVQDSLDTTLREPMEAARFLGVEVIGTLPFDRNAWQIAAPKITPATETALTPMSSDKGDRKKKGYYSSISGFEESVRTVRNTILLADIARRLRTIALTSAAPGEGKTTVTAHLGIANAAHGRRTLLVDGDLRRPTLHAKFELNPQEGLSNVLTGGCSWRDVVIPIEGRPNLYLLPSGPGSHRAADLIGPMLSELLNDLQKEYDLIIIDAPPLLGFAECLQMATAADGVLIISRAGETKRKAVAAVVSTLRKLHANVLGVVLNQVSKKSSLEAYSYYGYSGYGGYGYSYGQYSYRYGKREG